jgi:hypothetical protein
VSVKSPSAGGTSRAAKPSSKDVTEQDTQENAVVGVREVTTEEDVDWGFDDDPADYSAAV